MNETPTLALLGIGAYLGILFLFLLYPGEYDREWKRNFTWGLLGVNALVAVMAGVALTLNTLVAETAFHLPHDPVPYLWTGVIVLAGQLAFVHTPVAFGFQRMHRSEAFVVDNAVRLATAMLYKANWQEIAKDLEGDVQQHAGLFQDLGLYDLAFLVVERADGKTMRPVDLLTLLLERTTYAASWARQRSHFPFRGLNEMLSAAGAGVIVALSVQLSL